MIKFYSLAEDAAQRLENFLKQNDCRYMITDDDANTKQLAINDFHNMAMLTFNDSVRFISETAKTIEIDNSEFAHLKTM